MQGLGASLLGHRHCILWEGSRSDGWRTNTLFTEMHYFRFCESLLCFFCSKMQFQQNIHHTAICCSPVRDCLQQMQGIHRLNQGHIRQHQLKLISLQVTNEMPAYIGRH